MIEFPRTGLDSMKKEFDMSELRTNFLREAKDIKIKDENRNAEGALLITPNGKRSNLKEAYWRIARTSSFKSWFGDWESKSSCSVVVDENGEPKVMTHRADKMLTDALPPREKFSVSSRFMHFTSEWKGTESTWRYGKVTNFAFLNARKMLDAGAGGMKYYDYPNSQRAGFVHNIDDDFLKFLISNGYDAAYASGVDRDNYTGPLMYTDELVVLNPPSQVLFIESVRDSE
ncbi:MAG: hypothetical protein Q7S50_03825 [bacterium]|nr:hypothetical protein [bacterium]